MCARWRCTCQRWTLYEWSSCFTPQDNFRVCSRTKYCNVNAKTNLLSFFFLVSDKGYNGQTRSLLRKLEYQFKIKSNTIFELLLNRLLSFWILRKVDEMFIHSLHEYISFEGIYQDFNFLCRSFFNTTVFFYLSPIVPSTFKV